MADINKIITLSSWGGSSGPLYNAYYSTDGVTYTIAISGSDLYLPNIGSSATIVVPDTTNYIKLINSDGICGEASASIYAGPATTTSTTSTTSTSTTSTSTTSTSTSTTSTSTSTSTTSTSTSTTTAAPTSTTTSTSTSTSTSTTSTSTSTSTTSTTTANPFPSGLNSGLLGRFEVTNNLSWPGSGSIMYNLSTASLYATSSTATIWSASAVDTTNGVQLNGSSTRVDFGIISTYNSGSYIMNSAMTASNECTIVYLATLDSTGGTNQCGLAGWNDYFADTGQSKYISLLERTSTGGQASTNLRSNNSYNAHTISSYFTNDTIKMYGVRVAFSTNNESYWRGTANVSNFTPSGTQFNADGGGLVARNTAWTFGARGTTTLNSFQRFWKGKFYAAYFWNRRLSDTEMGDLQTYLNTYVKANS